MNRKKIVDVCLSAVAVSVLLAVALAFSIEMRKGASPTQAEQHYEVMKEPLQPVAVEPDKVAPVEDNKKVR